MRLVIVLLALFLSGRWVSEWSKGHEVFLQFVYMLASLLLYLSYINHNEVLSFLAKYLR